MILASLRSVRCDAIINAAAYTQVDKAESEPDVACASMARAQASSPKPPPN